MIRTGRCRNCEALVHLNSAMIAVCPICSEELEIEIDLTKEESAELSVLIVDDDPAIRRVAAEILDFHGYWVVASASNGPDTVIQGQRHQPRFVLLDFLMPAINGEETARLLRRVSPDSIIVAFSAILVEPPSWADGFLRKTDIAGVDSLLKELAKERATTRT
ncbi:MAG: response regulator [Actinomycetota bacterium]|nr:response regulator [Actinomycetota bacterium]